MICLLESADALTNWLRLCCLAVRFKSVVLVGLFGGRIASRCVLMCEWNEELKTERLHEARYIFVQYAPAWLLTA
jgi:hypothetical protein